MILEEVLGYIRFVGVERLFSIQNLFLIFIGITWLVLAVIQDFRKREVANWWNFSLIVFVLSFRAFVSVNSLDYWYFLWGLIGLGLGFLISNLFYYSRLFAGGDAKLVLALFTILPLANNWQSNLVIFTAFIILFILTGSIYGLVYSIVLSVVHRKRFSKEFLKQFKENRKIVFPIIIVAALLVILFIILKVQIGIFLSIVLLISPVLLIYAKAIEESSMIKEIKVRDLTIGDWIIEKIKVGKKTINPNWEGLNEEELKMLQKKLDKNKKIFVKEGIPFTPSFLFGFLLLIYLVYILI